MTSVIIRPSRIVTYSKDESRFVMAFPYDVNLIALVKQLPGRRWNPDRKCWTLPASPATIENTNRFFEVHEFSLDDTAIRAVASLLAASCQNVERSSASAADLDIPTLCGTLMSYQRAGVMYAIENRRIILADEMGLGKTVQALATLEAENAFPSLIICPASLKLNWAREIRSWLPHRTVRTLSGRETDAPLLSAADILIINYDILDSRSEELASKPFKALVADEAHYLKNGKTKRAGVVKGLCERIPLRLLLTGTPFLNRPSDGIELLRILGRLDEFGGWKGYTNRYCQAYQDTYGWRINGASNLEELNTKLRQTCYVRRLKSDVLQELPDKRRVHVDLDVELDSGYTLEASGVRRRLLESTETLSVITELSRLRREASRLKVKPAIEWIENFLESGEEKLILFVWHRDIAIMLADRFGAPFIIGDTAITDRQAAVDRFQSDSTCRLIVGNLQAMGIGLTLTAASNVAFLELPWTPALLNQAEDRAHRIGQKNAVTVWYLLASGTIDDHLMHVLDQKRDIVSRATNGAPPQEPISEGSVAQAVAAEWLSGGHT